MTSVTLEGKFRHNTLGVTSAVCMQAKLWVKDVVVRFRLCPFAEGVFNSERGVRYVVSTAEDTEQLWKDFFSEVGHLTQHTQEARTH